MTADTSPVCTSVVGDVPGVRAVEILIAVSPPIEGAGSQVVVVLESPPRRIGRKAEFVGFQNEAAGPALVAEHTDDVIADSRRDIAVVQKLERPVNRTHTRVKRERLGQPDVFGSSHITEGVGFCCRFLMGIVAGRTLSRGIFLDRDGRRGQDYVLDIAKAPDPVVALKTDEITV